MFSLPKELIDQFVKVTNDVDGPETESTIYATVSNTDGGNISVRFDGMPDNSISIPIDSTVSVATGDKVIVTIKNHEAIITGNVTNASAGQQQVNDVDKTFTDAISNLIGPDRNNYEINNTEDSLQFKDGDMVTAEVKDQGFRMLNAEVQNELKMGEFLWVQHGGNLGLLWKGENNG